MGEDQWFQPTVKNKVGKTIVLRKFNIKYGKFYNINNRFKETPSPQGESITSEKTLEFGHCGRENSPSGTEGTFEIEVTGEGVVARIYWDCPWSGSNQIRATYIKDDYDVSLKGFKVPSGELGKGTITVRLDD